MANLALSWSNTLLKTLLDAPCLRKWEYKLFLSLCELQKLLYLILLMILAHALHRFSHALSSHFSEENSLGALCISLEFSLCSFIIFFLTFVFSVLATEKKYSHYHIPLKFCTVFSTQEVCQALLIPFSQLGPLLMLYMECLYVETIVLNVAVFGDGVFGRYLGLDEVRRGELPWWY